MSLRDKKANTFKAMIGYAAVSVFSGVVTFFYYMFDHGLRDNHMTFLFVPGLVMVTLFFVLAMTGVIVDGKAMIVTHFAFALLWFYLLLSGIYTMAKTGSSWLWVYLLLSGLLWAVALALEIVSLVKAKKAKNSHNE